MEVRQTTPGAIIDNRLIGSLRKLSSTVHWCDHPVYDNAEIVKLLKQLFSIFLKVTLNVYFSTMCY